jgi:hypothetical protein
MNVENNLKRGEKLQERGDLPQLCGLRGQRFRGNDGTNLPNPPPPLLLEHLIPQIPILRYEPSPQGRSSPELGRSHLPIVA